MTPRALAVRGGIAVFALAAAWLLFFGLPKWYSSRQTQQPPDAASGAALPSRCW